MKTEPSYLSDIDLRLLYVFRAVVQSGGLSAAQVPLGISLATISKHLSELENKLAVRLCSRGHAGFALTVEGESVYQACLELFASIETFQQRLHSSHTEPRGHLRLGITDNTITDPNSPLIKVFNKFRRQAVHAHLDLTVNSPDKIELAIMDKSLDAGLIPDYQRLPGLDYQPVYEEICHLYCSKDHPLFEMSDEKINQQELSDYDYVGRQYVESMDKQKLAETLKAVTTAFDTEAIALLILSGSYIGFLPNHYAAAWLNKKSLRKISPNKFHYKTNFYFVTRKTSTEPTLVRLFKSML